MIIQMRYNHLCLLAAGLILIPLVLGEEVRPAKVLVLGNPGNFRLAAAWLEADPLTDPRMVPARTHLTDMDGAEIQRFIRQYFPRNYEKLLEFEYMMLIMVEVFHLTHNQQRMLYDAIYEAGLGGMQDRSVMSMAEYIAHPWADSILSDPFPNDADRVVSGKFSYEVLPMRYVINTNPNIPPIFTPYKHLEGVERSASPGTTCIAIPKEGAVVTSYTIAAYPTAYPGKYPDPGFTSPGWMPHTMYWRYGNGTTWTHHDMLATNNYWDTTKNPYVPDMILAEFIFSTGRKLPDDVVLVHRLRTKFANFMSAKSFIYSLLDFIDKFGANGGPIVKEMVEITRLSEQGKQLYLRQEYVQSLSDMERAIIEMDALRLKAMKLKDRALIWIYAIEWLSVTGVFLVSGFAIWTLMVRRRLYREVTTTRLLTGN